MAVRLCDTRLSVPIHFHSHELVSLIISDFPSSRHGAQEVVSKLRNSRATQEQDSVRTMENSDGVSLPRLLQVILTVRVGEPHGRSRGGWKREVAVDTEDGFSVFREKCLRKVAALADSAEAAKKRFEVPKTCDVYLKQAKNDAQDKYVLLNADNFTSSLLHRWKLLNPRDRTCPADFNFEAFVYVRSAAPAPVQFYRATAPRIQNAQLQRRAYEAAQGVAYGPIAAHHLDIVNARRPDTEPFSVPQDNTTAQAIELDRQRDRIRMEDLDVATARQEREESPIVQMKMNGVWVPVQVDVRSLRRALGLPDHDIFTAGIFHDFTPNEPTNADMDDVDHLDDEDHDADDDDGMME